jgi:cysteine desulfurase
VVRHYLDHASTSPPRPEVVEAMTRCLAQAAGDPSRIHEEGQSVRLVIEEAREQVAAFLDVRPRQVVFTSGGTEAINGAVWGAAFGHHDPAIVCSGVEHSAVRLASARAGTVVAPRADRTGRIDPDSVREALLANAGRVALVHCQLANHEVGTIQPVREIAEIAAASGALVHVDAVSAFGHIDVFPEELGADLVSISAHKMGGPLGIGAMIVRRGLRIEPLLLGAQQERARRAGLENLPAIVGFAAAVSVLAQEGRAPLHLQSALDRARTERLAETATAIAGVELVGDPEARHRLPWLICVGVDGVEAEPVLIGLDRRGIAAHSGSACSAEGLEPSPVLDAMGVDPSRSLRLSVGWSTTEDDISAFEGAFAEVVSSLRALRSR